MFTSPIEQKREPGKCTWNTFMASALVAAGFFFQGILLYTIFGTVVGEDASWRASIMGPVNVDIMDPGSLMGGAKSECVTGNSLCFDNNGTFSCAPPSVQLTSRWDELDKDGDGIWSRAEAVQAKDDIMCRFGVDPLEVFEVFATFLQKRSSVIWLHPDVVNSESIPKPYFTYAIGDIIMCGYRNEKMCPNLLKRGIFDTPLRDGTAPRVGNSIESAIDYCYELLTPGGICDRTLPSTYATWKITSEAQCLEPSFSKYVYTHPGTGEQKSMLEVDYSARADFEHGRVSAQFFIYKSIILGVFVLAMFVELKDIVLATTWVFRYPSADEFPPGEAVSEEPADPDNPEEDKKKYTIKGITKGHRCVVGLLCLARFCLTGLLTFVGASFLLKQNDYIALLMDAVGLVFIIEIGCVLYAMVIQENLREQTESTEPMHVNTFIPGFLQERPALSDILGAIAVSLCVVGVMWIYYLNVVEPMSRALECACISRGKECYEAQKFDPGFWNNYWSYEVPEVFRQVELYKTGTGSYEVAPADPLPAKTADRAARPGRNPMHQKKGRSGRRGGEELQPDHHLLLRKRRMLNH